MNRKITVAAGIAALVTLGACSRGDDTAYDSTAGLTAGAMATPPAPVGLSVGASTSVDTTTPLRTDTLTTKKP